MLRRSALTLFCLFASIGAAFANCADGEKKLRLGVTKLIAGSDLQRGSATVKERVDRNLQGRFCLDVLEDDNSFASDVAMSGLQEGAAEMVLVDLGQLGRFVTVAQAYRLPFAFRHERALTKFQTASNPALNEVLKSNGAFVLANLVQPSVHFGARKPLFEPSDMAGAKVRTPEAGNLSRPRLRPLDAVPQAPSDAGIVEDLKAGRVDIVEASWSELQKLADAKMITHALESHHLAGGYALLVSNKWWEGQSDELRKELSALFKEAVQQASFRIANADRNARNIALAAGLDVRILTDGQRNRWIARMSDLWGDFRASNPPAVVDALESANRDF
ncbi:TRAP transporter substrate-binding protein [Ahrensia sp. R2A130]|uniref:TRAP transporter substrate-binding protein n=1 Tax=Ahrensia sp. R2A130 TaxID=744979 RepID=UPI0001E0BC89|nr:TRAP transporter substrate-binding protein DctP [Ahrensia sp. R2A130]EFL88746.1 bacterial extracellular solute-binding protein, family 7 [Ahrensia sp. R2A130]